MTETQEPNRRRGAGLQTKALAGLVAIMLAAAIVALVFVVNGGGNDTKQQAGGPQSDVGNNTVVSPSPSVRTTPTSTAGTTQSQTTGSPTTSSPTTKASTGASGSKSGSSTSTGTHSSDSKKVVYTVKKGDTLIDIGRWYSDHGYLKLYDWNKSVIGKDPNLIFPGQKIIVVDGTVGVARHSH